MGVVVPHGVLFRGSSEGKIRKQLIDEIRENDDIMLTRYACYLIAQNGDSRKQQIASEYVTNNEAVRQTLLNRGIWPESLPPAKDVKKVERRLASADKKSLTYPASVLARLRFSIPARFTALG